MKENEVVMTFHISRRKCNDKDAGRVGSCSLYVPPPPPHPTPFHIRHQVW